MADTAQEAILRQGSAAWNEWRRQNPWVSPRLRGASLVGATLPGANLRGLDLRGVHLQGANLRGADLSGAQLRSRYWKVVNGADVEVEEWPDDPAFMTGSVGDMADLTGADLTGADLSHASLHSVFLAGANLSEVDLAGTTFYAPWLEEAVLDRARCFGTIWANTDFSRVRGLASVAHSGPSTLGIDTIYRSDGCMPDVFLRGCGVPEELISYAHSLVGKSFEFYSCFISYSSKDHEFAQRLYADLQSRGVRCWFAPADLRIGDRFRQAIDESIKAHDKLLVVLSENSVGSSWVEKEVETAFEEEGRRKKTVLFPIRLDQHAIQCEVAWAADIRRTRHIGDFTRWHHHEDYMKAFDRLLRNLKSAS